MFGNDPYGNTLCYNPDTSGNGRVSAKEAFDYANFIHDPYDTPVFSYQNSGRPCWLGRNVFPVKIYFAIQERLLRIIPEPGPLKTIERIKRIEPRLADVSAGYEKEVASLMEKYGNQMLQVVDAIK